MSSVADSRAIDSARRRWDEPYGKMGDAEVARVMSLAPFSNIDESRFPKGLPLRDVIRNDTRIRHYRPGDVVVREGDFGNSAFFLISGEVSVSLSGLPDGVRGEATDGEEAVESQRVFVQDLDAIVEGNDSPRLRAGQFFGEISAMGRTARTATIVVTKEAQALELRWQALRDVRRYSDAIRHHLDEIYRAHSLVVHLCATPIFQHLSTDKIELIAERTIFQTFGEFDWYGSYKEIADDDALRRLEAEPLIVKEGDYPNGLILIRSGFARVSQKMHSGHRTVEYLGRGGVFGLQELQSAWQSGDSGAWRSSLRAVGYVDVLIVPTVMVERYVLPHLSKADAGTIEDHLELPASDMVTKQGATEFLVENRFINGTAAMVIDLEKCIRCDDCVRACASTHGGIPRFERQGKQHANMMVAHACMHCSDPVCMIGCPTGAIHRKRTGEVVVNANTCIGCGTCANSCPYDNINIIPLRNRKQEVVFAADSLKPQMTASKCDLCVGSKSGPACVAACSHDAIKRVDLSKVSQRGGASSRSKT